jgi:protein-S-isoprenylcysteine O-methyltransferase Ste14
MTRKFWFDLGSSLLAGMGIIVATFVTKLAAGSGWLVLAGPLLLAIAFVGADMMNSRLRGKSLRPSPAVLIMGGAFLLAGAIVIRDPNLVATLIPIIGVAAWVALLRPDDRRETRCIT